MYYTEYLCTSIYVNSPRGSHLEDINVANPGRIRWILTFSQLVLSEVSLFQSVLPVSLDQIFVYFRLRYY